MINQGKLHLMFTHILSTLQVAVWRDVLENLYTDIGDKKHSLFLCLEQPSVDA